MKHGAGHDSSDSGNRSPQYKKESISLSGAVALGTSVMIGAGIFALTGQVAELARQWFPLAFLAGAIVSAFSAYSYVKLSNAYPSAGGIAMFLEKAYGKTMMTGACALLMYISMVINESLVARTFGSYVLQIVDVGDSADWLVPALGVGLLVCAFLINLLGNRFIQGFSFLMAFLKIGGISLLAVGGLWVTGGAFQSVSVDPTETSPGGFLGAVALCILAYKGFTTITNSGSEIKEPHKNVGRAIIVSIALCTLLYLLVSLAVGGNLTIEEIVRARDYSLAEAARPAFGDLGVGITVLFAIVATVSGVVASVFAVSRMLAMLTDMKLVPHSHFGMPGDMQKHTLVYTVVIAIVLTVFLDLGRIAALGAVFYIVMDIAVHWGILRHLREEIHVNAAVLVTAMLLDIVVLGALLVIKGQSDPVVIYASGIGLLLVGVGERIFLRSNQSET